MKTVLITGGNSGLASLLDKLQLTDISTLIEIKNIIFYGLYRCLCDTAKPDLPAKKAVELSVAPR